ncbi:MAG: preprotein translocase subunit SecE [Firmicutes bacterium]|nr:preprotein translocase subunit SecE [Bacillota bacterium]
MDKLKSIYAGVAKYLKSVQTELKRVSWPSKQELKSSTVIVLLTLVAVTVYLWACDSVLAKVFELIRK